MVLTLQISNTEKTTIFDTLWVPRFTFHKQFFPLPGHSGILAQNFIQIYTNLHMGMFMVFKEAERIKELEFVVKLRCFSPKIE